ncbi:YbaB/EbfC family nucleoid-associated protein [Planosporangium mesophilum]|uniref:YbaB/EbfC DNA-binding family protein n=1 Tax=Planosporangium mesophilum TaxID=689768 RepID=A0A8J3TFV8_9ACTN|nr:YbaB/EbfC family nucleoid-associated protein [Planosporangium mesophilum]NJC81581.1 YbaB/EbfC family nucleoid-associated protein [Planosporangium mesophilum]GII20760.1 hypothetical protein Pme01_03570 [Planosporangium mesophilum]
MSMSYGSLPDPTELARLRDDATELASRFSAVDADPETRYLGTDEAQVVRISLDGRRRVADVVIAPTWRSVLGAGRLGTAVEEAVVDANREYMEAWANAFADEDGGGVGAARNMCSEHSITDPGFEGAAPPIDLRALMSLFDDVWTGLSDLDRYVERATEHRLVGRNSGHQVTVTLVGGEFVDIAFDHRWLAAAENGTIASAVRDALRNAQEVAIEAEGASVSPGFEELRSLVADPATMLRRLGLS